MYYIINVECASLHNLHKDQQKEDDTSNIDTLENKKERVLCLWLAGGLLIRQCLTTRKEGTDSTTIDAAMVTCLSGCQTLS